MQLWKMKLPYCLHDHVPLQENSQSTSCALPNGVPFLPNTSRELYDRVFLLCTFARAVWSGGPLGLLTHQIQMELLQWVSANQTHSQFFHNSGLWAIWYCRNQLIFHNSGQYPLQAIQRVNHTLME